MTPVSRGAHHDLSRLIKKAMAAFASVTSDDRRCGNVPGPGATAPVATFPFGEGRLKLGLTRPNRGATLQQRALRFIALSQFRGRRENYAGRGGATSVSIV